MTLPMPTNYREVAKFMLNHSGPKLALVALFCSLLYRVHHGWGAIDLVLVSGLVIFRGFLEWIFHKYVWHSHPLPVLGWRIKGPIATMHANHHKSPHASEGLIFGAPGVLGVCVILLAGSWLVFGSASLGVSVLIGFLAVLMIHEWHHVLAHSNINPVAPVFRKAVMCHRMHHHGDPRECMGVSSVLADKVMGTCKELEQGFE